MRWTVFSPDVKNHPFFAPFLYFLSRDLERAIHEIESFFFRKKDLQIGVHEVDIFFIMYRNWPFFALFPHFFNRDLQGAIHEMDSGTLEDREPVK